MGALRLATRKSALALAQARLVAHSLADALGTAVELVHVTTRGDRIQDVSLAKVGGKGLFVKEVEATVLRGDADLAVHSAKDLPAELDPGLVLAALPERGDPRDAFVAGSCDELRALPRGARVGTGSLRRRALLLAARPDLSVEPLRGNVDTRLRKLREGPLDAVILACAGLDRLGLGAEIRERIAEDVLLPAPGQGTLAVQARAGASLADDVRALDCAETRARTLAERSLQAALGGDCNVPLAAHARVEGGSLRLEALLASLDGTTLLRAERSGPRADAERLGAEVGAALRQGGGDALLDALRAEASP